MCKLTGCARTADNDRAHKARYYAVHLTVSGTYFHRKSKANAYAGRQNVTDRCMDLLTDGTAKRFCHEALPGDVVMTVGSRETVAPCSGRTAGTPAASPTSRSSMPRARSTPG
ncbi:hypothetical protein [Streptomyces sp. CoH27]|uniref:hypothetical protein n=1 Tax=Streptomyces sp. CoH27 TaxID=2875763 RepID=UPI001CD7144F|nr:hypothetical protein [Streptomyces sp. CoH27]